ncbi:short-chain dehydrogenase [Acetobacter nitrogenifigens DSM 23921 = NBRC 105050]|uniref:Short-chain dehydrogenase n=1 Tax=Acetobacter nitrogenifigens DSM 23921 = NBRC 105050 TaxID=1120919 RepID=A0A511XEU1_9PROT|nr:SDR family NAD(P)-dependent oxidoreductase [Acetobacter nitrogenifigens]GBQ99701.1 short-chain dehydrogenase [Acetobacter nitrogenifigens DSM 23921 = NBRC 105050]GEN61458.1 short-chain dehydrogenase [Acetobacter nitrogenifigens DSM 23921 = NBRC 105050]
MTNFKDKYGHYALVVGASAGIGEAIAKEIASRGVNLVLVARRGDRLEALARDVMQNFNVQVRCVALDLLQDDAIDRLDEAVADLDIGLLVINAATVLAGSFLKNGYEQETNLIKLNVQMPAQIVHRIGSRLKQQRRGGILLVSSLAGNAPTPYQASYAASKAYLSSFGQALAYELSSQGVDVLVVAPGATDTEGMRATANIDYTKMKGVSLMKPEAVAKEAIEGLGKQTFSIPGAKNRIGASCLACCRERPLCEQLVK